MSQIGNQIEVTAAVYSKPPPEPVVETKMVALTMDMETAQVLRFILGGYIFGGDHSDNIPAARQRSAAVWNALVDQVSYKRFPVDMDRSEGITFV